MTTNTPRFIDGIRFLEDKIEIIDRWERIIPIVETIDNADKKDYFAIGSNNSVYARRTEAHNTFYECLHKGDE